MVLDCDISAGWMHSGYPGGRGHATRRLPSCSAISPSRGPTCFLCVRWLQAARLVTASSQIVALALATAAAMGYLSVAADILTVQPGTYIDYQVSTCKAAPPASRYTSTCMLAPVNREPSLPFGSSPSGRRHQAATAWWRCTFYLC